MHSRPTCSASPMSRRSDWPWRKPAPDASNPTTSAPGSAKPSRSSEDGSSPENPVATKSPTSPVTFGPGTARSASVPLCCARYERVCFDNDPDVVRPAGKAPAELLAPGHPLLDATLDVLTERYGSLLTQGAVLVAESLPAEEPHALVYLEHAVADARIDSGGNRRVVSRRFEFVELHPGGTSRLAGHAPYLDYRPATPEERGQLGEWLDGSWLSGDLEAQALELAVTDSVPTHLAQVRARTMARVHKVRVAVARTVDPGDQPLGPPRHELADQVEAGRQPKMNPTGPVNGPTTFPAPPVPDGRLDLQEGLATPPLVVGARWSCRARFSPPSALPHRPNPPSHPGDDRRGAPGR